MTTTAHLRKVALALPEVEEGTHFGMVAFSVRGKGFASVTKDGLVQLHMADDDAEAAVAAHAGAERLVRMGEPIGVRVPLAGTSGKDLAALVRQAWSSRAPKRLARALAEADGGAPSKSSSRSGAKPGTVDEYLATFDGERRERLAELRELVRRAAPSSTETLRWGNPAYLHPSGTILLVVSGHKAHANVVFTQSTLEAFVDELGGLGTGKGAVRIPYDDPVPTALLERMIAFRVREHEEEGVAWK